MAKTSYMQKPTLSAVAWTQIEGPDPNRIEIVLNPPVVQNQAYFVFSQTQPALSATQDFSVAKSSQSLTLTRAQLGVRITLPLWGQVNSGTEMLPVSFGID